MDSYIWNSTTQESESLPLYITIAQLVNCLEIICFNKFNIYSNSAVPQ